MPKTIGFLFLLVAGTASTLHAADPPAPFHPFKGFVRSPFTAEVELYSGGISGKSAGAAFDSATRGDYGLRFTFGFLKALNFNLNYMYSNQSRSFTAVTPPLAGSPSAGTLLMRAHNLNMFYGNGELNLIRRKHTTFYLSPGIGFARNGARNLSMTSPFGTFSSGVAPGTAVTFNLGTGVKIFPRKHVGVRIDLRDFVSGGGTGSLQPQSTQACVGISPPPPSCQALFQFQTAPQFFGSVPVQNSVVLTLGLIFKLL